jgi:hypothetical protein
MSPKADGAQVRLLKSIGVLDLDAAEVPAYIKALLNDLHLHHVSGYVDELYTEVREVRNRLDVLSIMESTHVSVGIASQALDLTSYI